MPEDRGASRAHRPASAGYVRALGRAREGPRPHRRGTPAGAPRSPARRRRGAPPADARHRARGRRQDHAPRPVRGRHRPARRLVSGGDLGRRSGADAPPPRGRARRPRCRASPAGWDDVETRPARSSVDRRAARSLVIDDLHALEGTAAEAALSRLVDYAPPWLRILAGSRVRAGLQPAPAARLRRPARDRGRRPPLPSVGGGAPVPRLLPRSRCRRASSPCSRAAPRAGRPACSCSTWRRAASRPTSGGGSSAAPARARASCASTSPGTSSPSCPTSSAGSSSTRACWCGSPATCATGCSSGGGARCCWRSSRAASCSRSRSTRSRARTATTRCCARTSTGCWSRRSARPRRGARHRHAAALLERRGAAARGARRLLPGGGLAGGREPASAIAGEQVAGGPGPAAGAAPAGARARQPVARARLGPAGRAEGRWPAALEAYARAESALRGIVGAARRAGGSGRRSPRGWTRVPSRRPTGRASSAAG